MIGVLFFHVSARLMFARKNVLTAVLMKDLVSLHNYLGYTLGIIGKYCVFLSEFGKKEFKEYIPVKIWK